MHRNELFTAINNGEIARAYLFTGPENYVKERAISALEKKLLPEGLEALNRTVLHQPMAKQIVETAETLPVFCEKRLVVVRDFAPLAAGKAAKDQGEGEIIADWLKTAPDTCCVVFLATGSVDDRRKSVKEISNALVRVEFPSLDDREMQKWVASRAKQLGAELAPGAGIKLAFSAGPDLTRIEVELNKLASYVKERPIYEADIDEMVTSSLESSVFKLFDYLAERRGMEAMQLTKDLLTGGEAPMGILNMLTRQVRILLRIKQLEAGNATGKEVEAKLKMNPYGLRFARAQAKHFSLSTLKSAYEMLVDTDEQIKSGVYRDMDALYNVLLKLI